MSLCQSSLLNPSLRTPAVCLSSISLPQFLGSSVDKGHWSHEIMKAGGCFAGTHEERELPGGMKAPVGQSTFLGLMEVKHLR